MRVARIDTFQRLDVKPVCILGAVMSVPAAHVILHMTARMGAAS